MVKNVRLMIKILYANFPGLSPAISARFTLEMCVAPKTLKLPILKVQDYLRLLTLAPLKSLSLMFVMIG